MKNTLAYCNMEIIEDHKKLYSTGSKCQTLELFCRIAGVHRVLRNILVPKMGYSKLVLRYSSLLLLQKTSLAKHTSLWWQCL